MVEPRVFVRPSELGKAAPFVKAKFNPLLAELLIRRGITTLKAAQRYLYGDKTDFYDPALIRNIERVFEIIANAKAKREKVFVFGDYDCDGVTASAIMYLTLRDLGLDVHTRLPDRLSEGYGMSVKAVDELAERGCQLIVTVDNGIKQYEAVKTAKQHGMRVIVLDHHTPDTTLPDADVVVDLHIPGETYPYKDLAGCGLAYKVAAFLYRMFDRAGEEEKLLDLAAIGTVADVVPLTDENRIIVSEGLKLMNAVGYERTGIIKMAEVFGVSKGNIRSGDIGFKFGPGLNAPGRLRERGAETSLQVLISDDPEEVEMLAEELYQTNEERKRITTDSLKAAEEYIAEHGSDQDRVMVLFLPGVPEGVVGLVAGRVTEKYNRPSIVFTESETCFKASARSIDAFDLYKGLKACDDLLMRWGGHPLAAGLSVAKDLGQVEAVRKRINEYAATVLSDDDLVPIIWVDKVLEEKDISFEIMALLDRLEPYGEANPRPIFWTKKYTTRVKDANEGWQHYTCMGKAADHLKIFGQESEAIGFGLAEQFERLGTPRTLELIFTLSTHFFMNNKTIQLEIVSMKAAEEKPKERTRLMNDFEDAIAALAALK